ncbi:hypothetical protein [uncultured Nostoc sp.]|uniref:hypothetical protein n=1 Tax=uncultured Nostoc sp. TaxID=340711 RepID=UPI0035CA97AB
MKKDDGKTLSKLTKQVNQTIDISDVLAGKKPIGGKIGKKLEKLQEEETSVSKGKKLRNDKFKPFDKFLERMELIANGSDSVDKRIKIERALIVDPKNPDKLL